MISAAELLGGLLSLVLQGVAVLALIEIVWFTFAKVTGRKY
jgi:hypothetical protein